MGYLCHVLVGGITALVSQSDKNQGNISRTNLIFWDQELPKLNKGNRAKLKNLWKEQYFPYIAESLPIFPDMGYLCHVLVGEIIALVSQSDKNQGNISRTNLIFWDQELPKLNKGNRSKEKNLWNEQYITYSAGNSSSVCGKYCQMPRNDS
ncbi:hypothetical protein CDAR_87921 [Caerostris darwini]|uniref:Uncharacterized protein n=1 Tax=Caerostris darwini TaxID=1538125 RepID=A0AAV4S7B0_9ARAC|nr:hypothetical protein CDAR_87921 [Caerostris darwini]